MVGIACAISLLAALLAAHRAGSGLLFVLGHQRLLPPVLARSARRTAAPRVASAVQSLLTGLVIAATAGLGRDPYRDLFVAVGLIGALGVLVLATVTVWVSLAHAVRRGTLGAVTVLAAVTATVVLAAAACGMLAHLRPDHAVRAGAARDLSGGGAGRSGLGRRAASSPVGAAAKAPMIMRSTVAEPRRS